MSCVRSLEISHRFLDSLAFCRKSEYRPELAWSCHDYAGLLLEREEEGGGAKAISLMEESLTMASELGMRPLVERVTSKQPRANVQPGRESAYPDGLTLREVEVIRLVAQGKTDREIAEELFVSFRTVGNHVRSILNKTGAASRTEAASYAHTPGLVGPNSEG